MAAAKKAKRPRRTTMEANIVGRSSSCGEDRLVCFLFLAGSEAGEKNNS